MTATVDAAREALLNSGWKPDARHELVRLFEAAIRAEAEATIRHLEERLAEYMLENAALRAEAGTLEPTQWDEDRLAEFLAPKMFDIVEHESKGTVVSLRDQARAGMWARSVARRLLHAGLALPRAEAGTLDVERLAEALHEVYCHQNRRMHSAPDHSAQRIAAEYARLAGADE